MGVALGEKSEMGFQARTHRFMQGECPPGEILDESFSICSRIVATESGFEKFYFVILDPLVEWFMNLHTYQCRSSTQVPNWSKNAR